jgi:hypothetical protein
VQECTSLIGGINFLSKGPYENKGHATLSKNLWFIGSLMKKQKTLKLKFTTFIL